MSNETEPGSLGVMCLSILRSLWTQGPGRRPWRWSPTTRGPFSGGAAPTRTPGPKGNFGPCKKTEPCQRLELSLLRSSLQRVLQKPTSNSKSLPSLHNSKGWIWRATPTQRPTMQVLEPRAWVLLGTSALHLGSQHMDVPSKPSQRRLGTSFGLPSLEERHLVRVYFCQGGCWNLAKKGRSRFHELL